MGGMKKKESRWSQDFWLEQGRRMKLPFIVMGQKFGVD